MRRTGACSIVAAAAALTLAGPAAAEDTYPCGQEIRVVWSGQQVNVQPCQLTSPLANDGIPVYTGPVESSVGATPPAPTAGWLHGTTGKQFVCESLFPEALYHHPAGWYNSWWAYTRAENGAWGWVPEVFFKGGDNDEPDSGLRTCPAPPDPPPSPPPAAPSPCEPSPAASGLRVRARFRNSRRVATARYGRRLKVRGRVLAADGSPVAGAALCVGVQGSGNAGVRATRSITTDASGRFSYELGRGPSRRVWFVHRVGGAAAAASVRVRVRAPVALRAAPRVLGNGQTVVLRGRLGGSNRTRGLLVELQYPRGRRWFTFATTRVRRAGRFRYGYRFTRTFRSRVYRLRARVPAQRGYPFATGASRPVRVQVVA
jgi:hypothetical protein